ncbi:Arm DNA-binding domain-containing protein [Bacteroides helcogenes]|uniref:Arm DNA-binding domain-containing protein n=1 Tax=Bacteroides helcogenes TaxID=290053 RepID=UPI0005A0D0CC|nr:Arm DNA-binding domain-containing protein [Bacteroides helcogenes]
MGLFLSPCVCLKVHLFARITVDGVASRFNTKLDVLPSIWDGKMGKATGRTSEAGRINRIRSIH